MQRDWRSRHFRAAPWGSQGSGSGPSSPALRLEGSCHNCCLSLPSAGLAVEALPRLAVPACEQQPRGSFRCSPRAHAFSSCHLCGGRVVCIWSPSVNILTPLQLSPCIRSPDMLRSEVSFSVGGRHSSTDSNKASSGDLSPYDNNSPVLSERSLLAMQEDVAPGGSEKLYKGPEQYVLVSHLPSSKSRESSPGPRLGKGEWRPQALARSLTPIAGGMVRARGPSHHLFLVSHFCNSVTPPESCPRKRKVWGELSHGLGGSPPSRASGKQSHAPRASFPKRLSNLLCPGQRVWMHIC